MPRRDLLVAGFALAVLVGSALGWQPSRPGQPVLSSTTTSTTRTPARPDPIPASTPTPAGNPVERVVPGGGRAADGPAASAPGMEAERRPDGSGGAVTSTTTAAQPSTTIPEPSTTTAPTTTTAGPATTIGNGTMDTVVN